MLINMSLEWQRSLLNCGHCGKCFVNQRIQISQFIFAHCEPDRSRSTEFDASRNVPVPLSQPDLWRGLRCATHGPSTYALANTLGHTLDPMLGSVRVFALHWPSLIAPSKHMPKPLIHSLNAGRQLHSSASLTKPRVLRLYLPPID